MQFVFRSVSVYPLSTYEIVFTILDMNVVSLEVLLNFLSSVITTWRTRELESWKRH
jgi:hypothetical protein